MLHFAGGWPGPFSVLDPQLAQMLQPLSQVYHFQNENEPTLDGFKLLDFVDCSAIAKTILPGRLSCWLQTHGSIVVCGQMLCQCVVGLEAPTLRCVVGAAHPHTCRHLHIAACRAICNMCPFALGACCPFTCVIPLCAP